MRLPYPNANLARAVELDYAISDRIAAKSFRGYLDRVVINSRPEPRRMGDIEKPFQTERAAVITPALEYMAGLRDNYNGPLNFWFTMPKGSDKTGFCARAASWALAYSKKKLKIYVAASDADQSRLVRDSMQAELDLNPWLKKRVHLLYKAGWGPGGNIEILASDAASAQGVAPDLLIADEICHWHNRTLFDALYSARNKRPACVTIIATNAGYKSHFSYEIREQARQSPRWYFYEAAPNSKLAGWMDHDAIAEDRKLLHPAEASRLLDNVWQDTSLDLGFATREEVDRCVKPHLTPVAKGTERNYKWYAAVDYGPKKDRTVLCLVYREPQSGVCCVERMSCWHQPGGTVLVNEVDNAIDYINAKYPSVRWSIDPYQMESTIQRLEAKRINVERFASRGGAGNFELASALRSAIVNSRVAWYPNCGAITLPHRLDEPAFPIESLRGDTLESELASLIIRPTSSGYRFDHTSNKHDDRAVALGMAVLAAVSDPLPPPPLEAPISVPSSPRDMKSLPFAAQRGLFGVGN